MNNGLPLKPFMCYFCNKNIVNETQQGHTSTCGALLEPCPYKCGAYTPRNMKVKHIKECTNKPIQSNTLGHNGNVRHRISSSEMKRTQRFSMDAGSLSNESFPNFQLEEIALLRNKIQNLDQLCKNLSQNLSFLKAKNEENLHNQQSAQIKNNREVDKVLYQNQVLLEWKKMIESHIASLRQEVAPLMKLKSEIDSTLQSIKIKISTYENLQLELTQFKDNFVKEQIYSREVQSDFNEKIQEMKDFFAQENAVMAAIWNDHKESIKLLEDKFSTTEKSVEEQKSKHASVVFDVRTVMNISSESSEKLEIQERLISELKQEMKQLKLDVEVLEESSSRAAFVAKPGHLLWKLNNFSSKMENAKQNNSMLKSPIFYSEYYGYKIRLIVYLNGIKKWKGRHLIAGIHVLNGEYDALLRWPCSIEGTLTLKDIQDITRPKDYSKFICAKRTEGDEENEDPQESSNQYIFIPHSILTKPTFIKDDTIFIEIKIKPTSSGSRNQEETNL